MVLLYLSYADVLSYDSHAAFSEILGIIFLFDEGISHLFKLFGKHAGLYLEFEVLLVFALVEIFFIDIYALLQLLQAVVVELIELEQRSRLAGGEHFRNLYHWTL